MVRELLRLQNDLTAGAAADVQRAESSEAADMNVLTHD